MSQTGFWTSRSLDDFDEQEWEALCDGCGRCCLIKLEDEESGELFFTSVICKYYDQDNCRCSCYNKRSVNVPSCIKVTPDVARNEKWLPDTCAYRLLAEGKPLFDWHPLLSGSRDSVHEAGISVRDKVVAETHVHLDELHEHIASWFNP